MRSDRTNYNGEFKLWVPKNKSNIKIKYNQSFDYISTNVNIGNSQSNNYNADEININTNNINGNINGLVFSDVQKISWREGEIFSGQKGSAILISSELKTHSYTSNVFDINNKSNNWSIVLYNDDECNGTIESWNEIIQINSTSINHDYNNFKKTCIISKVFIPLEANEGDELSYDLCVTTSYANTGVFENKCLVNKVRTLSTNANIRMIKSSNKTTAKPGESILYTIELKNDGLKNAENIVVYDSTPPYTSYVSSSCQNTNGSNVNSCVFITNMINNKGDIQWDLTGHLAPNESFKLFYEVEVDN